MSTLPNKQYRLRSFVRRGRRTQAQEEAYQALWPAFGLNLEQGLLDIDAIFGRKTPCFLEIGFGSGQSLLALAALHPEHNFIGVETHKPGIGAALLGVKLSGLTNLRLFYCDVIDVFEKSLRNDSLDGIQIFFPDPWQKRKHHPRRLIQESFISLVVEKLKVGGSLHLATDWEDYANHMLRVLSKEDKLINQAGLNLFANRSPYRPILTKFEKRAEREGRLVWELQFKKV